MMYSAQIAGILSAAISAFSANLPAEFHADKTSAPQTIQQQNDRFSAEWSMFMQTLQKESPVLHQKIRDVPAQKKLERILKALKTGIRPVAKADHEKKTEVRKTETFPAKLILNNSVFYARLDSLDHAVLKQLREDVALSSRLANKPAGAILDLRGAESGDYQLVDDFLALFVRKQQKPEYFHTVPVIVLCSAKTAGAPQLFTALTGQSKRGITMGQPCERGPFPDKIVSVNGKKWLVPFVEKNEWTSVDPVPYVPAIRTPSCRQIEFKKIGKVDLMQEDSGIRRACDLIRSLNAIQQ